MEGTSSSAFYGKLSTMDDRWKIMFNEQQRTSTYSVNHYIAYLRKYVSETGYSSVATTATASNGKEKRKGATKTARTDDSIRPVSYFIRKLKLDLKMAYPEFVAEFIQAPNNGLRLLLSLLRNFQANLSNRFGSVSRSENGRNTLRLEDYKRSMVDEQDCLLCIKYTLRIPNAGEELLEDNAGLLTVTECLLSNFSKSRITALEILTLMLTGPSSVDKVLDAFTTLRIKFAESTRFKMLINMMHTRGVSHVLYQVSCLRLLNTLLNMCRSSNMRVSLQYEMEEAGMDWELIQERCQGDGLEFDDLRKEIREWRTRYIDVDALLRRIRADMRKSLPSDGLSEFVFDQRYSSRYIRSMSVDELSWISSQGQGYVVDYDKWASYIREKQTAQVPAHEVNNGSYAGQDLYIPTSSSTISKVPNPQNDRTSRGAFAYRAKSSSDATLNNPLYEYDDHQLYDVISLTTSFHGSDDAEDNANPRFINDVSANRDHRITSNVASFNQTDRRGSSNGNQRADPIIVDDNWIISQPASLDTLVLSDVHIANTHTQSHGSLELSSGARYARNDDSQRPYVKRHTQTSNSGLQRRGLLKSESSVNKIDPYSFDMTNVNGENHVLADRHISHTPFTKSITNPRNSFEGTDLNRPNTLDSQIIHRFGSQEPQRRTPSPDYISEDGVKTSAMKETNESQNAKSCLNGVINEHSNNDSHNIVHVSSNADLNQSTLSNGAHNKHSNFPFAKRNFHTLGDIRKNVNKNIDQTRYPNQTESKISSLKNGLCREPVHYPTEKKIIPSSSTNEQISPETPNNLQSSNLSQQEQKINQLARKIAPNPGNSVRSYSAELSKVLEDLDETLETHGWRDSLKTKNRPLVAYV